MIKNALLHVCQVGKKPNMIQSNQPLKNCKLAAYKHTQALSDDLVSNSSVIDLARRIHIKVHSSLYQTPAKWPESCKDHQ